MKNLSKRASPATRSRGEERYTEIPVADLLGEVGFQRTVQRGPSREPSFEELAPRQFESLCARLLAAQGNRVQQAFLYGSEGQSQHGVDVLALCPMSTAKMVMQCKRVEVMRPGDLRKIFKSVERYTLIPGDTFIVATTFDAQSNNNLVETWALLAREFSARRISCEFWHRSHLLDLLRDKRRIVKAFFGRATAEVYCDGDSEVRPYAPFDTQSVVARQGAVDARNRSVKLSVVLPSVENRSSNASALVTFSRSDLSGIVIGIDSHTVTQWLQWQRHAEAGRDPRCPYLPGTHGNLFTAPNTRLELDDEEVGEFAWCLRAVWPYYLTAVESLDTDWRASRFPKSEAGWSGLVVKLCSVHEAFWKTVRAFIRAHDFDSGESSWHIFDAHVSMISIFTRTARGGFPARTHLHLWPMEDRESASGWIDICWQQPARGDFESRGGTSADQAHEWLLDALFPAALAWAQNVHIGWLARLTASFSGQDLRQAKPLSEDVVMSAAKWRSPGRSLSVPDWAATRRVVELLQAHFHAYYPPLPIPSEMTLDVVRLVGRLAGRAKETDEHYIRAKLGLGAGEVEAEANRIVEEGGPRVDMDHALRALLGVVGVRHELPASELNTFIDAIAPVWARYIEDQLCRTYS